MRVSRGRQIVAGRAVRARRQPRAPRAVPRTRRALSARASRAGPGHARASSCRRVDAAALVPATRRTSAAPRMWWRPTAAEGGAVLLEARVRRPAERRARSSIAQDYDDTLDDAFERCRRSPPSTPARRGWARSSCPREAARDLGHLRRVQTQRRARGRSRNAGARRSRRWTSGSGASRRWRGAAMLVIDGTALVAHREQVPGGHPAVPGHDRRHAHGPGQTPVPDLRRAVRVLLRRRRHGRADVHAGHGLRRRRCEGDLDKVYKAALSAPRQPAHASASGRRRAATQPRHIPLDELAQFGITEEEIVRGGLDVAEHREDQPVEGVYGFKSRARARMPRRKPA